MKHLTVVAALALLALSACKEETAGTGTPAKPTGPRPEKIANGEPAVITVKHVLIAFQGSGVQTAKRTRDEAQKLAYEILNRAKAGEDFDKLMKENSDDSPTGGTYTLTNDGITATPDIEYDRHGMVPAFGDVGFRIQVNEIAVAEHDAKSSPYGWHIIKRVK